MKARIVTAACVMGLVGLFIGGTTQASVINGGFEITSGAYTTGALGWNDFSGAPANTVASALRTTDDPFDGVAELTLSYRVLEEPGGGPAVIAQSDIFAGAVPGEMILTFQAKSVVSGFENNQVQVQWFDVGNVFLGATGFDSYNPTLTTSYSPQQFTYTAPAGTAGAMVQFLMAGSAAPGDTATVRIDNVTLIPEPSTFALAGAGLIGLLRFRRRKA